MNVLITASAIQVAMALGLTFSNVTPRNTSSDQICVSVTNSNNYPVTLTWAVYSVPGINPTTGLPVAGEQTLVATYNITVPANASNFEVCAPAFACAQYDLLQWDLISGTSTAPPTYQFPGGAFPPFYAWAITQCGTEEGTCRMTGGINLSTNQAYLPNGSTTTLTANGGGFQVRNPSQGTSNFELHLTWGGQTDDVKLDNPLTSFDCDDSTDSVFFSAPATVNGVSGYQLTVSLTDNGEPGRNDTVSLQLVDPAGNLVVWFLDQPLNLGGNLQFHAQ